MAATAVTGGLAVAPGSTWYRRLDKPSWQPPPQVFGPVWTLLYAGLAITSARTLSLLQDQDTASAPDTTPAPDPASERRRFTRAFVVNCALNAGWSWLFFRSRRLRSAAVETALLTASSLDLARRAHRVSRGTGWALAPYPAWCAFATVLNAEIARRNGPEASSLPRTASAAL